MQAEIRTDFLVLRKIPYGDTSLIIAGLSETRGQIRFLVRGARKISRKQMPVVDVFRLLQVVYREGKSDLHTWRQADLVEDFSRIARNYDFCQTAGGLARFALEHSAEGADSRQLFTAMRVAFRHLAAAAEASHLSRQAQQSLSMATECGATLVYLAENGLLPDYDAQPQSGRQLAVLLDMAMGRVDPPELSVDTWRQLRDWSRSLLADTQ